MKREADAEMGPSTKRTRSGDDIDVRLLIPSKAAGSVIGKGGHNITKLRTEYKASVTVPDCPGPERILTVVANPDVALEIIKEIIPCLEDGTNRSEEVDIRILVHQSQAGCIIGKSGFKIKELREKSGARIRIYSDCCPQSTDRIVQVQGRASTCLECLKEIVALIRTSPVKGLNNPYDPHNFDEFYAGEYGGFGDPSGKPGMRGAPAGRGGMAVPPGGPMGRGGRFGPNMGAHSPPDGFGYGGGPPGRSMPPGRGGYGGGAGVPRGFGAAAAAAAGNVQSDWTEDTMNTAGANQGPKTQNQVTIPKEAAGAIIGKGGARIRKIRSESGAGITIDEPLPNSNDRVITITGSEAQIQMAQYLLQRSVLENSDRKF